MILNYKDLQPATANARRRAFTILTAVLRVGGDCYQIQIFITLKNMQLSTIFNLAVRGRIARVL